MRGRSGPSPKIHHYGSVDFDGLAIQPGWTITPFADSFDGSAGQHRIDLFVHHPQRKWIAPIPITACKMTVPSTPPAFARPG